MVKIDWCFRIYTICPKNFNTLGLKFCKYLSQRDSVVAMESHKAAFDAGEVERLVILVVVILGAEVLIPQRGIYSLKNRTRSLRSSKRFSRSSLRTNFSVI